MSYIPDTEFGLLFLYAQKDTRFDFDHIKLIPHGSYQQNRGLPNAIAIGRQIKQKRKDVIHSQRLAPYKLTYPEMKKVVRSGTDTRGRIAVGKLGSKQKST